MKITTTIIEITPEEIKTLFDLPHHDCTCHQPEPVPTSYTQASKLIDSARKLDKAIEEHKPEPAPSKTTSDKKPQPKPEPTADKSKAVEQPKKEPVKAPSCVKTWNQDELNLLRTCPSDDAARFCYASHFKDARSEGAIRQKWYKLNLNNDVLRCGDMVTVEGGDGKQGVIQSFTDDHQYANIGYFGDPAIYQTPIEKLTKVNKE